MAQVGLIIHSVVSHVQADIFQRLNRTKQWQARARLSMLRAYSIGMRITNHIRRIRVIVHILWTELSRRPKAIANRAWAKKSFHRANSVPEVVLINQAIKSAQRIGRSRRFPSQSRPGIRQSGPSSSPPIKFAAHYGRFHTRNSTEMGVSECERAG